jgi:hypothetical protein
LPNYAKSVLNYFDAIANQTNTLVGLYFATIEYQQLQTHNLVVAVAE